MTGDPGTWKLLLPAQEAAPLLRALSGEVSLLGRTPKLTLGRVKGIPIRVDATFIVVPLALLLALPPHAREAAWPVVAIGTLGVFLSILLHELGHAVTAKLQQVGVAEIVVGGFYGFANLKRQAIPRTSLIRVLVAGPLTNLAIFLLLWLVMALVGTGFTRPVTWATQPDWWGEVLRILALINLAMFVFNSVPAYPLDGGRVLGLALDRKLTQRTSLKVVSVLSMAAGAAMILLGLGISLFLVAIGILVVMANLRRLRSPARARSLS